ncbi:MAG: hypothetical protein N2Z80_01150 [Hydrogenothermaceae bacterium]|nr:hypothetical protein [Hydrogenothermaceae bacterium]
MNRIFKNSDFPKVRLYGGVTSSNFNWFTAFVSYRDKVLDDGILIIRLVNVLSYNTVSFGFIPVGATYRITRGEANRIFEIDSMRSEYFLPNLLNNTGLGPEDLNSETTSQVLWEFPLFLIDEERNYVKSIRTFKEFNVESRSLEFFGLIENGSLIKLSTRDSEDVFRDIEI